MWSSIGSILLANENIAPEEFMDSNIMAPLIQNPAFTQTQTKTISYSGLGTLLSPLSDF